MSATANRRASRPASSTATRPSGPPARSERSILDTLAAQAVHGAHSPGKVSARLMMAAADAFAEKGFHATTTRDIASRAGLSPAGVYVHYSSKEELLFELSRRGHMTARDLLVAAVKAARSPTEALRSIIGGFSRWHAEHHQLGRIVQYEFHHLSPAHRDDVIALRREIDSVVEDVLADGVGSGEFEVDDIPATALALMSMAVDVARWYDPEIRLTPAEIERSYADLAVRLVKRH